MKNKIVVPYLIILTGSLLSCLYGPWWASAVFIVMTSALLGLPEKQASIIGATSLGLIFLCMAILMNAKDHVGIIQKTGSLLGGLSPVLMVVVTTLIGVLTGWLSGWLGSALGVILRNKK